MKICELFRKMYFERVTVMNSYLVTPDYNNGDLDFVRVCFENIVKGEHEHILISKGITKDQIDEAIKNQFIASNRSDYLFNAYYCTLTTKGITAIYNAYHDWTVALDYDKQKSHWMSNVDMEEAISNFLEQPLKLLEKERSYNYGHLGHKYCNDNTKTTKFIFNKPISMAAFVEYLRNNGYDVDTFACDESMQDHFVIEGEGDKWFYSWVVPYKD